MQFELTKALIDDILFSMEDQEGKFFVDTRDGIIASGTELDTQIEDGRYISLPDWDSSDGFRLMEHFAAKLKNPLIREELSSALNRGRGVFRAFKDILGLHPEAEKLWFTYKDRTMRREIISWYNALREEWGLEKIGTEPEETTDLVHEDFRFRAFTEADLPSAQKLHEICINENPYLTEHSVKADRFAFLPGTHAWTAESGNGEFAGFLGAVFDKENFHIEYLEVMPEFRGLGIGETLLARFLESIDRERAEGKRQAFSVYLDLPAETEGFSRVLLRENFSPGMISYRRSQS